MKKKLILIMAIIMVIAIGVTVLAGCKKDEDDEKTKEEPAITTVEQFIAKIDTATSFTITSGDSMMQFDGKTMYVKQTSEGITQEVYNVIEDDKVIGYMKVDDKWVKMENPISAEDKANYTVKKVFKQHTSPGGVMLDATLYDIDNNGVWTLKSDNSVTLRMENGKLVIKTSERTMTASLAKITVTLPDEVKNAGEANPPVEEITTVEQFIAKLDTATSFTMTSGENILQFDGKTMYVKQTSEGITQEGYSVIEDDKGISYMKDGDKWVKVERPISAEDKAEYTVKKVFKLHTLLTGEMFDATLYDIDNNGVWTLKSDNSVTLRMENGKLVIKSIRGTITASLAKITVTLPDEVKNAGEANPPVDEITTVEEFSAKLDTATSFTMTSGESMVQFDGKTLYVKQTFEGITQEGYSVIEDDKGIIYGQEGDKWVKAERPISAEDKAEYTVKKVFKLYALLTDEMFDATLYDIDNNGVWTLKSDNSVTLRMENGKLVIKTSDGTITASLAKITVTLPDEVKNAGEANPPVEEITTVEEFSAKLDTATSFTITMGEDIVQFDGKTMYVKGTFEGITQEEYGVIEDDKVISYMKVGDKWGKMESPISAEDKENYSVKKMFEKYTSLKFDEKLYNIKDGVWTLKSDNSVTLRMENGKLVIKSIHGTITASLAKITVTLPDEVKNAVEVQNNEM